MVNILELPSHETQVMFAYATGPLAWSIVAFRNSLVFHSLDKVGPTAVLKPLLTFILIVRPA